MDRIPRTPGIYVIRNLINGKAYVGSSVNLLKRSRDHFRLLERGNHPNRRLQYSYAKHGREAFVFEAIEHVPDIQMLIEREQHYIDTLHPEYNIRIKADSNLGLKYPEGMNKGRKASLETRRRLSESHKGQKPAFAGRKHTEESRRKMSESVRRNPARYWLDKKRSKETVQKMRQKLMGRPVNDRQRAGLAFGSKARIGMKHTKETRAKISKSLSDNKDRTTTAGRPLSDEHRAKMSKAWDRRRGEKPFSKESRRKMSESGKKAWDKRRAAKLALQPQLPMLDTSPVAPIDITELTQLSLWDEEVS